ncbi:MAG TPA: metallopeptidase TldD-related protein, partial [Steroidobacteraceae bacterium]|nr:metallopeptidase TldD-related protein [Steroidobacteraceae bacterium]
MSDKTIATLEGAMKDELQRSKDKLHLAGLIDPFFVSYTVNDNEHLDIGASFGALTRSSENHSRTLNLRLLVNNYKFNDENFSDGSNIFGGGGAQIDQNLPLDDDYNVTRRAFWLATDNLFKEANETFTKKKAALERKQLSDEDKNLPDFSQAPKAEVLVPSAQYNPSRTALESLVRSISNIFVQYKQIQNCSVTLTYNNTYSMLLNSEGTHTRTPQTECDLTVQATSQAQDDGEPLSLAFTVSETSPANLPSAEVLAERAEKLAKNLVALAASKKYDDKEYSGPVLFEDQAETDFLSEQIVSKFSAKREDVLGGGDVFFMATSKGATFQKKLDTRVLPSTVTVIDDPNPPSEKPSAMLTKALGRYQIDEEGVVPKRLELVKDGILKTMYMNRTPTKEVKE